MKEGSKRRRSSSPGGTRKRLGKRSRSWSPDDDDATAGWAPVPGKIHPAIGLDEVEAKRLYGLHPTRPLDVPLDDGGYRSDIFFCDRAAYQIFNDALARKTELGAWVRNGLRLGILFVHHNYDKVPGWRVISFLGRHTAAVPSRGKMVVLELLKLHSQEGDAACVESAKLFADAHGDKDVRGCSFNYVFVCGNTKFAELLRKDFAGVQQFLVKGRAVDKPRDVLFRLWHVTSESSAQTEEECLDERWKDYAYHERSWWCVRECVPYQ